MLTLDQKAITRDKRILQLTKINIGGKLNNGATLLAESKAIRFRSEVVTTTVLAVTEGAYQPFQVWTRCRDEAQSGTPNSRSDRIVDYCIQGIYFRTLDDALLCFNEEVAATQRKAAERNQLTIKQLAAELLKVMGDESGRTP